MQAPLVDAAFFSYLLTMLKSLITMQLELKCARGYAAPYFALPSLIPPESTRPLV